MTVILISYVRKLNARLEDVGFLKCYLTRDKFFDSPYVMRAVGSLV